MIKISVDRYFGKYQRVVDCDLVLKPSKIHGIGVFARNTIHKDMVLQCPEIICTTTKEIARDFGILDLCEHFGVYHLNGIYIPEYFDQMHVIWYVNHSDNPNFKPLGDHWISVRDIAVGEEVTFNYKELDPHIDNSL